MSVHKVWVLSNNLIWAEIKFNVEKNQKCCKHLQTHLIYVTTERDTKHTCKLYV